MSKASTGDFDVVVVGSGLGGISCAALLSRAGKRVAVVERADEPGGYAAAFRRDGYTFDPAIHAIAEVEFITNVLEYAGVAGQVEFIPIDSLCDVVFPDFSLTFPFGTQAVIQELAGRFPGAEADLQAFFGLRDKIFDEASQLPHELGLAELSAAAARFPTFFKYRSMTVQQTVDEHLGDDRLRALAASLWPYLGSPPSRCGFLFFSQILGALLRGTYYVRGSFQSLVDAFVAAIRQNGGELMLGRAVTRIRIEGGAVRGVELAGGDVLSAPVVVSNADATQTLEELVGVDQLPAAYVSKLGRLTPGLSAFAVYTGTTLDLKALGASHETFLFRHWDHDLTYRDIQNGSPGGMWISIPSLVDPSLAPVGAHTVILTSLARYDATDWDAASDRYSELLLDELERVYPGFRESITMLVPASPFTLERRVGTRGGAAYGWEATPRQTASGRLPHETPIEGLYLSGAWTQQGHSCLRAIVSGEHVARHLLGVTDGPEALPSFRPAHMPPLAV